EGDQRARNGLQETTLEILVHGDGCAVGDAQLGGAKRKYALRPARPRILPHAASRELLVTAASSAASARAANGVYGPGGSSSVRTGIPRSTPSQLPSDPGVGYPMSPRAGQPHAAATSSAHAAA